MYLYILVPVRGYRQDSFRSHDTLVSHYADNVKTTAASLSYTLYTLHTA